MSEKTEHRIECDIDGKLLARVCAEGIHLYCRNHHREELLSWHQIDVLKAHYTQGVEATVSDHTHDGQVTVTPSRKERAISDRRHYLKFLSES